MLRAPAPWKHLRSTLSPGSCLLCDLPAGAVPNLCTACAGALPRLPRHSPSRLVAYAYTAPVSTLIHWMKFEANLPAALTLGVLLSEAVSQLLARAGAQAPDAILPVPLHRSRLRERGFNQALELARPLARHLDRPLLSRACVRVRATRPQSSLTAAADRRRNVAGAFRLLRPLGDLRSVAIVDDVLTTGATVQALARLLREAGIEQIIVWACAGRSAGAARRPDSPPTGHCFQ